MALGVGLVLGTVWWYGRGADDVDPEQLRAYAPIQVTRVLARDGTLIGEFTHGERRTVVPYEALPEHLVHAFLAAEDADFFEHDGLDWPGIARAIVTNVTHGRASQGASTITQQVIKNTLLTRARTVERKSQELVLAGRVEAALSKREIFEIYVNEVYLGEGRYGVEEAARHYFGKSVGELDLGESAVLAALPRAPGVVTPYRRVDTLEARRDYVLHQMVRHGFATQAEVAPFLGQVIQPVEHAPGETSLDPAAIEFLALARAELIERYGEEALPTLGATVTVSVDLELQRRSRSAARTQLAELEARHGYGSHARPLSKGARERLRTRALRAQAKAPPQPGERATILLDEPSVQGPGQVHGILGDRPVLVELPEALAELPEVELARRFPPGSALEVQLTGTGPDKSLRAELGPGPELALALADVRSGELLVLVGGREVQLGGFDRARQARRQPGSTFKPVVYGAALRSKSFTPASTALGGNLDGVEGAARSVRLREALAQSDNAVALALMRAVGPEAVHAFARDVGIDTELGPHLSLALGTTELPPMELLTAYLTLARGGVGIEPKVILDVQVPEGLHGERPEARVDGRSPLFGVDGDVSALLTDMLTSVVTEGTAKAAGELGRPVAGKTGTTNDAKDAWFVGYTPDHAAVTWVGFDTPRSLGARESGSSVALPIWLAAMGEASEGLPVSDFHQPDGALERATIDERDGAPACRERRRWTDPERCTTSWWFTDCTPARSRELAPYLRCVSPTQWRDELFLAGTVPERAPRPLAQVDGEAAGAEAAPRARAELVSFSLFRTELGRPLDEASEDPQLPPAAHARGRTQLRERIGSFETSLVEIWRRALERDASQRAGSWTAPQPPAGTRLRVRLRLDGEGELRQLELTRPSGDELLDAWAEACVRRAAAASAFAPTPAMLEAVSGEAEVFVELVVGDA